MRKSKKVIFYSFPTSSTFIKKDIELLKKNYEVLIFQLCSESNFKFITSLISQFVKILFKIKTIDVFICHFASYASFFPVLLSKLFQKPCYIIVAGSDATKICSMRYGNFCLPLYGYVTKKSLEYASIILPVHKSLAYQDYSYFEGGAPAQGFTVFAPKTVTKKIIELPYGYDSSVFKLKDGSKNKPDSFITVGNFDSEVVVKRKGADLLIELACKNPNYFVTIVGWKLPLPEQNPTNLTILPSLSQAEIANLFDEHEYYCQLSIMEGFPNALAEAMIKGCIPIGSNVSAIPEMIDKFGYVLMKRDFNELDKLINDIRKNKITKISMQGASNHILTNYSLKRRENQLLSLIESET